MPVLFPTARSEVQDRAFGLDAGADDYLVKPFSVVELLARVREPFRRPMRRYYCIPDVAGYISRSTNPIDPSPIWK